MKHPDHSQYCNCICPEGLSYNKLEETLNRVRMLHVQRIRGKDVTCRICVDNDENSGYVQWPCMTMMTLSDDV